MHFLKIHREGNAALTTSSGALHFNVYATRMWIGLESRSILMIGGPLL